MLITALAGWSIFAAPALAAGKRGRGQSKAKAKSTMKAAQPVPSARAGRSNGPAPTPKPEETAAPTTVADAPASASVPGKPRVYTFGGLDVTGNLKAPQMLFFRGRVQQELDTSSPQKRSFLKELERTADAKGL